MTAAALTASRWQTGPVCSPLLVPAPAADPAGGGLCPHHSQRRAP